ncbi:MAG: PIG-L deacetylase family protein [Roseiflexaceae bacterium]|nr:PIG-L deacetylase family protein [Roseiflexaceae bacterium]
MTDLPFQPQRVLAIMAHPDDIEFMAGGTIARWARNGTEIHYCLLTDGNSGSRDPSLTPAILATMRREEQRAAGAYFGVASYTFLGQPDGRLMNTIDLRLRIARVIRQIRPDTIVTSDPQFFYSPTYLNHPDHRAAGETTMAAIMPLANTRLAAPELLEEQLEPHDVTYVYLAATANPTLWVALDQRDIEAKIASLAAHVTQVGNWPFQDMIRSFAAQGADGARAAGIDCEYAEAFVFVNLDRRPPEPQVTT